MRYGYNVFNTLQTFLGTSPSFLGSGRNLSLDLAKLANQYQRTTSKCVTVTLQHRSAGILTCCPSTTPFGLALGPTNPGSIFVAQETLVLRCEGFSPSFLLLMSAFSLPNAPPALAGPTSAQFGMLLYHPPVHLVRTVTGYIILPLKHYDITLFLLSEREEPMDPCLRYIV